MIVLLTVLMVQNLAAEPKLILGEFNCNRLDGWEQKSFKGETCYRLQTMDGIVVLKADSHGAASGLFKKQRIDLEQTPFLNRHRRALLRLHGGAGQQLRRGFGN